MKNLRPEYDILKTINGGEAGRDRLEGCHFGEGVVDRGLFLDRNLVANCTGT